MKLLKLSAVATLVISSYALATDPYDISCEGYPLEVRAVSYNASGGLGPNASGKTLRAEFKGEDCRDWGNSGQVIPQDKVIAYVNDIENSSELKKAHQTLFFIAASGNVKLKIIGGGATVDSDLRSAKVWSVSLKP